MALVLFVQTEVMPIRSPMCQAYDPSCSPSTRQTPLCINNSRGTTPLCKGDPIQMRTRSCPTLNLIGRFVLTSLPHCESMTTPLCNHLPNKKLSRVALADRVRILVSAPRIRKTTQSTSRSFRQRMTNCSRIRNAQNTVRDNKQPANIEVI